MRLGKDVPSEQKIMVDKYKTGLDNLMDQFHKGEHTQLDVCNWSGSGHEEAVPGGEKNQNLERDH